MPTTIVTDDQDPLELQDQEEQEEEQQAVAAVVSDDMATGDLHDEAELEEEIAKVVGTVEVDAAAEVAPGLAVALDPAVPGVPPLGEVKVKAKPHMISEDLISRPLSTDDLLDDGAL